ncbi:PREDICTED: POTE ankyrin domain family member E-like isoform X1 [Cyprinodon variegatus]|uniref:POTE ankyrin domain family member E-like isoform X1 n=2 Tax=Cyprinodon variegatus TaxID=28743 RepID=UPI0007429707|nr:PREDICTED: POTE ankyrin domain family member E-like isoform X1 [Cyprinodon variegatus]
MEVAKDSGRAAALLSEFEESYYAPAEALVGCAEDLIHRLEEILPVKFQSRESWAPDLERLKENLHSDVNFILQTLRAVSEYHHYHNKTNRWYSLVLRDSFLPELLSGLQGEPLSTRQQNDQMKTIPAWRRRLSAFLKKNPPPDLEELLHLSRLSASIPDGDVQQAGRRLSQRCMILRKLLISSGPVSVEQLQLALQWQYEALRCSHGNQSPESSSDSVSDGNLSFTKQNQTIPENWNPPTMVVPPAAADWKQSASSLFSGPHGLGGTQLQAPGGKDEVEKSLNPAEMRTSPEQPSSLKGSVSVISDEKHHSREFALRPAANLSSIQIIPKVEAESLNLEIKVKRSASPPTNPWLSLPVDELENSYTVTITPKPTPQKQSSKMTAAEQKPPPKNETLSCTEPRDPPSIDWVLHADSGWTDPELSPIHNILSSTITDGRETSTCATDGVPTLLWDSYDLHEEKPEADSVTDMSSMDWELKEQENLREVERILTKADGILEEEENVLAQEAVLDALLRAGDEKDLWHLWHSEKQLEEPSFDAGSSGDGPMLGGSDPLSEGVSAESTRYEEEDFSTEAETTEDGLELQEEPRNVPLLGPPSRKENLNLQDLRRFTSQQPSAPNPEREAFRLELEREKREVEKLEKSLKESSEWRNETGASGRFSETESGDDGEPTELSETRSNESLGPVVEDDDDDEEESLQCHGFYVGGSGRNLLLCDTKASSSESPVVPPVVGSESLLTSELMLQEGGFDPGGRPAGPEPASLPVDGPPPTPEEEAEPAALGVLVEGVTLDDRKNVFNPNITEHINNNNNNLSVCGNLSGRADGEEDSSTGPLLTDVQQTKPDLQPELQTGPSQRLEFDPGGPEELVFEGVRISDRGEQRTQLWAESFTEIADFKIPVILDVGSGLMKAGFSDQDQPNIKFPTITGVPKYEEIMNGTLERETYIGHDAQHMRGVLTLRHPIRNGIICNWDDMEKIWHYTFQQLCVDPEDHPVLLTEAAMNPLDNRQRMVEIMFERFGVPFAYVAMQAVLALYAAGRTTGVVFDSGEGVSHSVPVFEGYGLPHAIQRFPLAGCDVTAQLKKLLQEQGVSMRTTAEEEIVREMKERCCCVALDYEADMNPERSSCREMLYTLPDGQIITLGTERFRAPEILFKPEVIGRDHYGMHESVFKSVLRSDIDLRRSFLSNIVLSGGNTLLPGLPERLQAEVKNLLPQDMRAAVRVTSPKDRDFLVWSGGAVLANLSTFSSAWISQAEYDEHGPQIVFRKCF